MLYPVIVGGKDIIGTELVADCASISRGSQLSRQLILILSRGRCKYNSLQHGRLVVCDARDQFCQGADASTIFHNTGGQ